MVTQQRLAGIDTWLWRLNPAVVVAMYPDVFLALVFIGVSWDLWTKPTLGTASIFPGIGYLMAVLFFWSGVGLAIIPKKYVGFRALAVTTLLVYCILTMYWLVAGDGRLYRTLFLYSGLFVYALRDVMIAPDVRTIHNKPKRG